MNLYSFSILLFAFGVLLVAVLALVKRKDDVAIRFLFFSFAVCGWGFPEAFWLSQNYSSDTTLMLARTANAFAIWIPITWFRFVLTLLKKKEPIKFFYFANYALAGFLTSLSFTPYFVLGLHPILNMKYYPSPGPFYHLFTASFSTLVPMGFTYLISAYKSEYGRRDQLKHLMIATVVGFLAGSTTFLQVYKIDFPLYFLPLMILYPFFMGIGLIRHGLFDAHQIADAFQREKITALGIMAASLNHEMRNPLYIARGKIEVYRDGVERGCYRNAEEEKQKVNEAIFSVAAQLDRTLEIMQRFSDFARPNTMVKKERVSIERVFKEASDLVVHEIEKKNIVVKADFKKNLHLTIHRRQFEEILVNLMINACHAMERNGGQLDIRAYQPNDKIIIEISDTGLGISESNLHCIYDPFFTTKGSLGSGLGLFITKQLVEKNGGKISVKSKLGKGTNFILEFKQ